MANISDASGCINIPKEFIEKVFLNSKEEYLIFIKHFRNTLENKYYSTTLCDEAEEEWYPEEMSISFYAEGKWSYQNNLHWFHWYFCKFYSIDECLVNEEKLKVNEMLQRWKNNPDLYILFEYIDFEPGEPFLVEENVKVPFDKNEMIFETKDYEITKENMVKLNLYNACDCVDISKEVTFEKFWQDIDHCITTYEKNKGLFNYSDEKKHEIYDQFIKEHGLTEFITTYSYYDLLADFLNDYEY